jgi:hypothetical protein
MYLFGPVEIQSRFLCSIVPVSHNEWHLVIEDEPGGNIVTPKSPEQL